MPGSPESKTTCPSPPFAFDQRRSSKSSSSSRPTSSVSAPACRASKRLSTETCSYCRPGSHRSFDAFQAPVSQGHQARTNCRRACACSPQSRRHSASQWPASRAAMFGVSPTIACSCEAPDPIRSPTTTRPVAMPTRVCNGAWVLDYRLQLTNSSPARTARSASSSWACGYPKYTSTPSPMYFATNPPKRPTVSATHFW